MSYVRRYSEVVSRTVTVSWGPSENGGSKSVTVDIPVQVNIHVDTNPFDASVGRCNQNVNLLTSAVVATEAAQIASISKNSQKVAGTIVNGFFGYIRSEISQQITELVQKVDAHLLHLRELAKSCVAKQSQMEVDYHRISERYIKVFDDLNRELENRVYALNQPAFNFRNGCSAELSGGTDLAASAAIAGAEGGQLQAIISASAAKKRAVDTIAKIEQFLWRQKHLQSTITRNMLGESAAGVKYSPVCYFESGGEKGAVEKTAICSAFLPHMETGGLTEVFERQNWHAATREWKEQLRRPFNQELASLPDGTHGERVRAMMIRLFDASTTKNF